MKRIQALSLTLACTIGLTAFGSLLSSARAESKPAEAAQGKGVERARRTVKMLDEIYKTTIVLVTEKYVNEEDDFAAGSAAVLLFKQISEGGSHQVRLLDATGEPYEEKNAPQDDFEKDGIKALKSGAADYQKVVTKDGKKFLRMMTPVPVVMQKCTMCHENYKSVKPNEPIGAISYEIAIQ